LFRTHDMASITMAEYEEKVAARLEAVMEAFGIASYPELAEICEASKSAVNNWMNGYNLPRVPEMTRLCERTGITLDWLYRGMVASMDPKQLTELNRILRKKDSSRTGQ
jgi:transcriptional regulator with XRE-family HTH domain